MSSLFMVSRSRNQNNADISTELPCFSGLTNPGQRPVKKVHRGTYDCYISTDEVVERYCYRSRDQYFMVTKLRNYSTTAEATMTKFKLSSEAIYLGGNPKKELSSCTGY